MNALKLRYLPSSLIASSILLVILLLAAGDIKWYIGWIYIAVALVSNVFSVIYLDADLTAERAKAGTGTKKWDIPLALIVGRFGPLGVIVIAGLDHRFGWAGAVPAALVILGFLLFILSYIWTFWAMRENRFFSGVVRIQKERGHRTVDTGPYRIVRHPGYLGFIVYIIATPFALESYWALIPAILTAATTVVRTILEDDTLKRELEGYVEYAGKVRYRIIPGIW